MNKQKILNELQLKYPGKAIICLPEENPSEIIVELEPTLDHPEHSLALAIVGKSEQHYHRVSTEIYEVTKGELTLNVDGKKYILAKGEKMVIEPKQKHFAEGDDCWFLTYSKPGWTQKDHILV